MPINNPTVIGILLISLVFIAVAHFRTSATSFYLGTRQYGATKTAFSIVAAFTGGGSIINLMGLAAQYGYYAFFDVLPAVVGLLAAGFLAYKGFFGRSFSSEFFDITNPVYSRYAVRTHYFTIALLYVLVLAAQFRGISMLSTSLKVPSIAGVVFAVVVIAIYAWRGFSAVTRTDFVQCLLLFVLFLVLLFVGFQPVVEGAIERAAFKPMPITLIMALSLPLFFVPISQEIHQRGASARDEKSLRSSYLIAAFLYMGTSKNPCPQA